MIKRFWAWYHRKPTEEAIMWCFSNIWKLDVWEAERLYSIDGDVSVLLSDGGHLTFIKVLVCNKPVCEIHYHRGVSYRYSSKPVIDVIRYNYGSWVDVLLDYYAVLKCQKAREDYTKRKALFDPLDE